MIRKIAAVDRDIARVAQAGITMDVSHDYQGRQVWTLSNSAGREAVVICHNDERRNEIVIDGFEEEDAIHGTVSHMTEHPKVLVAIEYAASKLR